MTERLSSFPNLAIEIRLNVALRDVREHFKAEAGAGGRAIMRC
jgi:hypothetical protein